MDKEMFNKIVAIMLVFLLCFADIALLGSQIVEAASVFNDDLEKQSTEIGKTEVAFDAYFQDGVGKKHSKKIAPEEEDKIYLEVKVPEGYLTEASIKIENANFKVQETDEELSIVQEISSDDNKITLNKINKGEAVILEVPIKIEEKTSISVDDISKKADVKLQGKYVDNEGKEMWLDKTIEVESTISTEVESLLTEEVSKYVSFDVNGSRGVILQTLIKSKLVDNKLPIKSTTFDIQIPVLNNEEPEVITLTANSMMATNGEKTRVFTDEDYEIENGVIKLTIKNSDELLSWEKEAEDELLLTCIYGENAISNVQTQVALNTKTSIEYYSDEVKTVEAEVNETKELTEQIGDIINLNLETNKNELYKGYMKTEGAQDTIFDDKIDINIGYSKLVDKLLFKDETTYTDVDGNMFPSKGVYKYTRINKDNFEELLGEEGYINIYKEDGTLLVTLNKDNLEYTYEEELTNVIFETSKPLTEGILEIENGRGIKSGEYSAEQVTRFAKYSVNLICNIIKDDQVIISGNQGKDIELIEDETKADLVLSQDRLSTVALNEGVEVRVNLKTTEENSTLYKNPKIKITFPQYITGISAENVKLLYEDELKIKEATMYVNETNKQVIEIALEGEQTKYNDVAMAEGATLIVDTDISVDKLTPSRTLQAELEVVNEKNGQTVIENKDVNFVAPVGMMTINQMTGYNELGESATAVGGEMAVGKIQKNTVSKTARVSITVANNYNYTCENIKILGRTPFQGNKSIKTQDNLNSTFTAKMLSGINIVSGLNADDVTVYYSENGEATTEQDGDGNNWRTDITDFSNIKSYMIVIKNKTLQTGESISFNYDVEIPENLESNQSAYSTFAVYYAKSADEESRDPQAPVSTNESTESTPVGITTGEGPNLAVELTADVANEAEIAEESVITYTAKVTNKGKMPATDVTLTVNLPNQAYLATWNNTTNTYDVDYENKAFTFTIDEIGIGKTETVKFTIKAGLFIEIPKEEPLPEKTLEDCKGNQKVLDKYNEARKKQQAGEELTAEDIYPDMTLEDFNGMQEEFEKYQQYIEESRKQYREIQEELKNRNKISIEVSAKVEGYEDEFKSNNRTNTIIDVVETLGMTMTLIDHRDGRSVFEDEEIVNTLEIRVTGEEKLTNVDISGVIPDCVTLKEYGENAIFDEKTRTLTYHFDELSNEKYINITVVMNKLAEDEYEKEFELKFKGTCAESEKTFESNIKSYYAINLAHGGFEISQTSDKTDGYMSIGENITYEITIKNNIKETAAMNIIDVLPEELEFVEAYYTQKEQRNSIPYSGGNEISAYVTLETNEIAKMYVVGKAKPVATDTEITNEIKATDNKLNEFQGNSLKHTILASSTSVNPNDPNNPNRK